MRDPSVVTFEYGSPGRPPTLQDIVDAAEAHVHGTTWIAAVSELAITHMAVPPRLERTEWPTLSSEQLVELLSDCPLIVEADFEGFGEFRNAYWTTFRVADGNCVCVNSAQHDFIRRLSEKFGPLDD